MPVQVFATDLNEAGVTTARAGVYPKDIAQDVSPERLRRFFVEVDGQYRIAKEIREACIFSRHNVLGDPPFSRIDLISCRNVLIYLERVLQQKVVPTLHYALKPGGFLWLGSSETVGTFRNLFQLEDGKHRIYAKKPGSIARAGYFPVQRAASPRTSFASVTARPSGGTDLHREAGRLLSRFAPPSVLVTAEQEAANEELQSANEEVQSANEELQSINEELETSKEELQSSNEELATVNDELSNRNVELGRLSNDLVNLLGSIQTPIVMLGPDLRIKRFTSAAEKLFHWSRATSVDRLAQSSLNSNCPIWSRCSRRC